MKHLFVGKIQFKKLFQTAFQIANSISGICITKEANNWLGELSTRDWVKLTKSSLVDMDKLRVVW
jgi:hypothetical protein